MTAMAARHNDASREALSRLPNLDIRELRDEWRRLYKSGASPHLSRELLIRAVAYRMQEVALGGLRPEPQRQLRQIAQELKQTGETAKRFRPQVKPGTRLMREWQGRTYEVVVLDDGFSWLGTRCNSLSAIARKITGTAWSGPLFFGLKQNRSASRRSSIGRQQAATFSEACRAAENRCPATLSARLPRHGKHCCPCRRLLMGRRPPGSERRACGGASIAKGDADPEDEDDGQQATPQTSNERRKVRYRRGEPAGSRPPAHTPTAHSTGSFKVHGDPNR